jgi:hypothetical protein
LKIRNMSTVQKSKTNVKQAEKASPAKAKKQNLPEFPLNRTNYILMGVGVLLMIIGYVLMYGKEDIYSFSKVSLSVIFVMAGFVVEIFAIMKRPKSVKAE